MARISYVKLVDIVMLIIKVRIVMLLQLDYIGKISYVY